jgi:hypothetical protein
MSTESLSARQAVVEAYHLEDLKRASTRMSGPDRRAFQAEMALKYCGGSARQAEQVFGWSRQTVQLGLHEKRRGIVCVGAQAAFCGHKLWEQTHPEVAQALWALAQAHSQQDPSFRSTLSFTRLTARAAIEQLRAQGFADPVLPAASTMAEILNRNGYRLRPVLKAKPQKKSRKPMPSSPTSSSAGAPAPHRRSCV